MLLLMLSDQVSGQVITHVVDTDTITTQEGEVYVHQKIPDIKAGNSLAPRDVAKPQLSLQEEINRLKTIGVLLVLILAVLLGMALFFSVKSKMKWKGLLLTQKEAAQLQHLQLYEQNQKLEALNQEKNMMMGMLAHDLRDPLAKIEGLSNILLDQKELTPRQSTLLAYIKDSAQSLSLMSQRLLDFEALEAGKLAFVIEELDIIGVVEESLIAYKSESERKKITFFHAPFVKEAIVLADKDALRHVIDNLVSNALKFSPAQSTISIHIEELAREICVSIMDEGPGIPKEDLPRLFEKFQTLSNRPTGGEKSTGLGLALVKKYLDALNGSIEVRSKVGQGSTFSVYLPKASSVSA